MNERKTCLLHDYKQFINDGAEKLLHFSCRNNVFTEREKSKTLWLEHPDTFPNVTTQVQSAYDAKIEYKQSITLAWYDDVFNLEHILNVSGPIEILLHIHIKIEKNENTKRNVIPLQTGVAMKDPHVQTHTHIHQYWNVQFCKLCKMDSN